MTGAQLLPWTVPQFENFFSSGTGRAHAYLLAGHSGLGKTIFAQRLAKSLLCQEDAADPCGQCHSCKLFESGSHPDLHVLQSEKRMAEIDDVFAIYTSRYLDDESKRKKRKNPSAIIAIDQVRRVIPDINTRPHISSCRLIIINAAEDLNINAANSLLKSLEEPPSDSYFLLISHEPGHLLPTLRSRCNRIDFRVPERQIALRWLQTQLHEEADPERLLNQASGIPLRALDIATGRQQVAGDSVSNQLLQLAFMRIDPSSAAAALIKTDELKSILECVQIWVSRLIRLKVTGKNRKMPTNEEDKVLIDLGNRLNFRQLYAFLDRISKGKQLAGSPLDPQLALEDELINWQSMFGN